MTQRTFRCVIDHIQERVNMEFHEKLQELRKSKGLTQEELAGELYVSRTAISKWESGRGYPNIDSLKAVSKYFSLTIDDLLSGNEMLKIAEEDHRQKEQKKRTQIIALLDCCHAVFFLIPLFRQEIANTITAVSLIQMKTHLSTIYFAIAAITIIFGIITFALQNSKHIFIIQKASILLSIIATLVFTAGTQPYAAVFAFIFLLTKGFLFIKTK